MVNIWDVDTHGSHDHSTAHLRTGRFLSRTLRESFFEWLPLFLMLGVIVFIIRDNL